MKNLVIWDFNGTILDDREACRTILNTMLGRRGIPEVSEERYLEIFRFPVSEYYKLAGFDFTAEPFEDLAVEFIDLYNTAEPGLPVRPGSVELLRKIHGTGRRQVLLSATERDMLLRQVRRLGIGAYFDEILGNGDIYSHSKQEMAEAWFARSGLRASDAVLIGDTAHDWEVARALGCDCILVAGGHYASRRLKETG
ncbi:MAG: HAD family hydrolase, partial [Clostridiales bacterium]|nr:HAD family hydrolase [Clostridiales bacterium]